VRGLHAAPGEDEAADQQRHEDEEGPLHAAAT
jgi:hypothetical protein